METDLKSIEKIAIQKDSENEAFRNHLSKFKEEEIDKQVHELNNHISPQIDCTACGNCCRSLMINVDNTDAQRLSDHLQLTQTQFMDKYVEVSSSGNLAIMNAIPCHFLHTNKCTVYEARPAECREFPGLHRSGFVKRSFTFFMHYGRCPIIFNVIEKLKQQTGFL